MSKDKTQKPASTSQSQDDQAKQIRQMLDQIVQEAKDLRDHGYTALDQSSGAIAAGVAQAQKQALNRLTQLKKDKSQMVGQDAEGWQKMENGFHNFFAKNRVESDERAIRGDLSNAEKNAKKADDAAANAVQHAMTALKAAEVALLDDIQAWAYADELNADMSA